MLNKNPVAVEIGKKNLSLLCHSIGIDRFLDTDELSGYQTVIKLGPNNRLYGFSRVEDTLPVSEENFEKKGEELTDDDLPF
jgi:hypothetical protein